MKKKILSLICSAALAISAVALPIGGKTIFDDIKVNAAEVEDRTPYEWFDEGDWQCCFVKEDGKTRVWLNLYRNETEKNVVVPSMIRGYKVTRMREGLFHTSHELEMTDITIPSSINCIEGGAFYQQCANLRRIHLINNPNFEFKNGILYGRNVTKVSGVKYSLGYEGAKEYEIKKSVIKCVSQNPQVEIEAGVDIIDDFAFDNAYGELEKLQHVIMPAGIKVIGFSAFNGCSGLQEANIPYGCEIINQSAFTSCWELKNVSLPSTLKYIGNEAFSGTDLKSVYVPESVEWIGWHAFTNVGEIGGMLNNDVKIYGNYKEPSEDGESNNPAEQYCENDSKAEYANATDKDGNFIINATHDPDDPFDHSYVLTATVPPTCTTPGGLAGICFCGYSYFQQLPPIGHAYALQGVDADGTVHYKCTVCNEEKSVRTGVVMVISDKIGKDQTHDYSALDITVFDSEGQAAKDADVNGTSKAAVEDLEDGKYTALVSMTGFVSRTVEFNVTDGKADEVDAELHMTGDITGDGNLNASDLLKVKAHIKGVSTLEDYDYDCANIDENDKLNASDLLKMKAHIKGVSRLW